jgi:hypothetical protein
MICLNCTREHKGTYASGKFCSEACARSYANKFRLGRTPNSIIQNNRLLISSWQHKRIGKGQMVEVDHNGDTIKLGIASKYRRVVNIQSRIEKLRSKIAKLEKYI